MKVLKVLEFIKNNSDWEEKLKQPPYNLLIKKEGKFVLLMYSQISSDFNEQIVRECRGIILDITELKVVCFGFEKFGNYMESYVPEIDWNSVRSYEKLDGSIIKLWNYDNEWHISSNTAIDAGVVSLITPDTITNLKDLFLYTCEYTKFDFNLLPKNNTYIFELCSPLQKIVIPYDDHQIYHIGTRNMDTLEEIELDIGVKKPKIYNLNKKEELIEYSKNMDWKEEGFVIVDKYYNRVKIKSPAYVGVHHLGNTAFTRMKIIKILLKNEKEEILTYYPDERKRFEKVEELYLNILKDLEENISNSKSDYNLLKKEFFEKYKENKYRHILIYYYNGNTTSLVDYLNKQTEYFLERLFFQ